MWNNPHTIRFTHPKGATSWQSYLQSHAALLTTWPRITALPMPWCGTITLHLPALETFLLHFFLANVDILEEYRPPSFLNKMFLIQVCVLHPWDSMRLTHSQQNFFPGEASCSRYPTWRHMVSTSHSHWCYLWLPVPGAAWPPHPPPETHCITGSWWECRRGARRLHGLQLFPRRQLVVWEEGNRAVIMVLLSSWSQACSSQMKMLFQCPSGWRWGRPAATCAATLPDRNLSIDCLVVANSSSLECTSSHAWRLCGPSRVWWRRRAHPGRGDPSLFPRGTSGMWMSNGGSQPPPGQGAHLQFPQDAQRPWDDPQAPFPVVPSLLLCISPFINRLNIHNVKAMSGDLPCLKKWREAAVGKEKLSRPLMDSGRASSWLWVKYHGCSMGMSWLFGSLLSTQLRAAWSKGLPPGSGAFCSRTVGARGRGTRHWDHLQS